MITLNMVDSVNRPEIVNNSTSKTETQLDPEKRDADVVLIDTKDVEER